MKRVFLYHHRVLTDTIEVSSAPLTNDRRQPMAIVSSDDSPMTATLKYLRRTNKELSIEVVKQP